MPPRGGVTLEVRGGATQKRNRRTRMKRLKVFLVVFFAVLMLGIGTGITTVQAYRLPEQNCLALGVSLLVRGQGSAVANPLDAKTVARIENGSLTLREIAPLKKVLQESINRGFKKWQVQRSGVLMRDYRALMRDYGALIGSKPDNETARNMLFAFLSESPAYRDQFRLYDRLQSREIELKIENITRQVHEAFKNINLIIEEGQLVRKWNDSVVINNTNCTAINRVYRLEVNGTILTFVKVSIYSPDGVKIVDPYGMLVANPLMYWTWVWGGWWTWYYVPVVYGMDYLSYTRFPGEPSNEGNLYYMDLLWVLTEERYNYQKTFGQIGSIAFNAARVGQYHIAAVLGAIAAGGTLLSEVWYETRYQEAVNIYSYNYAKDPSFGFEIMQRLHLLNSPQAWDPVSFTTWHFVNVDGTVFQEFPDPGLVQPIYDAYQVSVLSNVCVLWIQNYGANTWIQWGPYAPPE